MANPTYPNEWARLIAEIVARPGWSKAKLARTAGVGKNTPDRWISGQSANVSAKSVRMIADAADIDYARASAAAIGAQEQQRAGDDKIVLMIMESEASDEVKQNLISHVRNHRDESEGALLRTINLVLRSSPQTDG